MTFNTITLAGIAAGYTILKIVAIANEYSKTKDLKLAIKNGYNRSIFDVDLFTKNPGLYFGAITGSLVNFINLVPWIYFNKEAIKTIDGYKAAQALGYFHNE